MRRTAVFRYKATFVDEARIKGREVQAAASGIFPSYPTLKDFLRDKPACLVTLRCVWNYAHRRTAAQCRAVLENYVVHGGDRGLTAAAVRSCCGLSVAEGPTTDAVDEALRISTPAPSDDDPGSSIGRSAEEGPDEECAFDHGLASGGRQRLVHNGSASQYQDKGRLPIQPSRCTRVCRWTG